MSWGGNGLVPFGEGSTALPLSMITELSEDLELIYKLLENNDLTLSSRVEFSIRGVSICGNIDAQLQGSMVMKAPQEIKRYVAKARSRRGKSNGVVRWLFDHPELERKMCKNKRLTNRRPVREALSQL